MGDNYQMALSYFDNKDKQPADEELARVLGATYKMWNKLKEFVHKHYPAATEEWNFSGKSLGWGFRLKDNKRVIVYLIPGDSSFKVSLVYGEKATNEALASKISDEIKAVIISAKVYREGRGFRFEIRNDRVLEDIKTLIRIKPDN